MIDPRLNSTGSLRLVRLRSWLNTPWAGPIAVALWSVGWYLLHAAHGGGSWHFFAFGANVLSDLDDGTVAGLHVYAEHPVLQIGPFALGVAWALGQVSDGHSLVAAQLVGAALGAGVVLLVRRIARQLQEARGEAPRPRFDTPLLVAIACFVPVWLYAAVASAHLDDVLALAFGVAALSLALARRPVWAGLAVAVAVDSKPWALPFVVVLLVLPSVRTRAVAVGVAALGVAAAWLPFFIADPHTSRALHYTIANGPLSGLRLLDVMSARTPPWDRPLQTLLGIALGGAAIWRGRASGVLLVVMASRLALDPSANRYYTAGLAAGALLWDVTGSRRRWPWWTLTVLLALHAARWVPALDPFHGFALVAFAVAAAVSVLRGNWGGWGGWRRWDRWGSWGDWNHLRRMSRSGRAQSTPDMLAPMTTLATDQRRLMLNKVPEVTVYFWVIKILCTTVGESFADYINETLGFGLGKTTAVFSAALVVVLVVQFRLRKYVPSVYWLAVVLISVVGTLLTDNLTDGMGVPLWLSTAVFAVALGGVFAIWYAKERTLSIHSIVTTPREAFYWLTVLVTFALGTAAGDWTLDLTGWSAGPSVLLPLGLIAAVFAAWKLGAGPVLCFWLAYILTRPLGANIGDFLASPGDEGGAGLGTLGTSVLFLGTILAVVVYLSVTHKDRIERNAVRDYRAGEPVAEPVGDHRV